MVTLAENTSNTINEEGKYLASKDDGYKFFLYWAQRVSGEVRAEDTCATGHPFCIKHASSPSDGASHWITTGSARS